MKKSHCIVAFIDAITVLRGEGFCGLWLLSGGVHVFSLGVHLQNYMYIQDEGYVENGCTSKRIIIHLNKIKNKKVESG